MPFSDVPDWVLFVFLFAAVLSGWLTRTETRPSRRVRATGSALLIVAVVAWLVFGGWLAAIPMLAFSALVGASWWRAVRGQRRAELDL